MTTRRDLVPNGRKLTTTEESTLLEWVLSMDQRGLAPRFDTVRQMANLLLQTRCQNQDNLDTVGQLWVYNLEMHVRFRAFSSDMFTL